MDPEGSPCYHNFLLVHSRYHSKVNLVGPLDAKRLPEAGCLYVFIIGFPASLFIFFNRKCAFLLKTNNFPLSLDLEVCCMWIRELM